MHVITDMEARLVNKLRLVYILVPRRVWETIYPNSLMFAVNIGENGNEQIQSFFVIVWCKNGSMSVLSPHQTKDLRTGVQARIKSSYNLEFPFR